MRLLRLPLLFGRGLFCSFWLGHVLRATTACTFSSSQLPKKHREWCALHVLTSTCAWRHNGLHFFIISTSKVLPELCFVHFDFDKCFVPHQRALFHHLNFQKCSENGVLCTFWLGHVLRPTTACNFHLSFGQMAPHPPLSRAYFSTLRSHKSLENPFRVPASSSLWLFSLLWSSLLFSALLFASLLFSSLALSTSAFPLVHISGSLTSKLPSDMPPSSNLFPHIFVWGSCFWFCTTPLLLLPRRHLSHTTLSPTIFHTPLCHKPSFTHHFVTHHLSHTTLSHTIFHTPLCHEPSFTHLFVTLSHTIFHTPLCHPPSFTHHFVTNHLSHTTLSHTIFHTPLCHPSSLTPTIFHTHHLSHTTLSHTTLSHTIFHTIFHTQLCHTPLCHTPSFTHTTIFHTLLCHTPGTWWHPSSFCVAGVALMALGWLWWRAWGGISRRWRRGTLRGRRGTWRQPSFHVAGVAHGAIYRRFAWQALMALGWLWWRAWGGISRRWRRGTLRIGVALMALGWLWWRAWGGISRRWRRGTPSFHVAGVALGDIHLRFAWQVWHLWHWAGSCWTPWHFAWQAWHLVTSTFVSRGSCGTYGTGLALVVRLDPPSLTHHLCNTPSFTHHLSHTIFYTQLCHTPSLTPTIFHTPLCLTHSHTIFHHTILHTPLCHTPSLTAPSFTHHLSHTTLSPTVFHTPLWHKPSFTHHFVTHHFVTHHLSHITLSHTIFHHLSHTQLCHTPSFATPSFTHHFVQHHFLHNFVTRSLSRTTLSHTHTIFLCHTPSFTYNFVTHNFVFLLDPPQPPLSFLLSPSPLQNLVLIIGRSCLVGSPGRLMNFFKTTCGIIFPNDLPILGTGSRQKLLKPLITDQVTAAWCCRKQFLLTFTCLYLHMCRTPMRTRAQKIDVCSMQHMCFMCAWT